MLAAFAAVTVWLSLAAMRLRVEVDPDGQLPQDHPYIQALNDVHRLFGDKNLVIVGLFPHDGHVFTPAFLRKLAEITSSISRIPGANSSLVQSIASPAVKGIRGTEDGIEVEPLMEEPPTTQAGADAVRERTFANDAYMGTLVSSDGSAATVQASFELTPKLPGYRHLHAAVEEVVHRAQDGTFDVRLSGPVIFLSEITSYASRVALYFPLALIVIGLVHYHAFRTFQALLLPLVTALLSVLWAIGLMGFLGVPLDPYNATTPILILAVAAGHAVQVLKRFYEEYERVGEVAEGVVAALERVGPVMLAAGAIAALSFCSLATFRTATIRTFGLFTGFGIASALAIELTIIPAVRSLLPAPRVVERAREAGAHPWLDAFLRGAHRLAVGEHQGRVFVFTGALLLLCGLFAARIHVDTSLKQNFRSSDVVRMDDAVLNRRFAGTNTLVLLVEGDADGALEEPAILRAVDRLERRLEAEPGVGKAFSFVDLLSRMHAAMNADRRDAGTLPATRAMAAQYLFLYSLSGGAQLDTLLDPTHRQAKVRLLVHEDSTRYGQKLIAIAREFVSRTFPPGYRVRYTGTLASTAAATEVMVEGKIRNIIQIGIITFAIASLLLRSLLGGVLVIMPLAITVAVNFGVMGLLGIPLDATTSAISAMAVGIGADYAIYVLFRVREERSGGAAAAEALDRALMTSGKAVLFVSTAIAYGYATLCLSGFRLHVQLGALVALAMLVSSASALVVLPALVTILRPRFLDPRVILPVRRDLREAADEGLAETAAANPLP